MTAPSFPLDVNTVRQYMSINPDATSRYSDSTIGSNIRTALSIIESKTGRFFGGRTQGMTFTTSGEPYFTIPGLRTAGTVQLAGYPLTVDQTYWLVPDVKQSGVSTGVKLRGWNWREGSSYLSSPEWFDRNLDNPMYPGNYWRSSIPNDLVFGSGTLWGYTDANMPDEALMAVKVLAAYLTKLADTNFAQILGTTEGNVFDLSAYPPLVQEFVKEWAITGNKAAGG